MNKDNKSFFAQIIVLFASTSTLICCALPALLVTIGATGALISLFSNIPFLVTISENKEIVFIISGCLLAISFYLNRDDEVESCEIDENLSLSCNNLRKTNKKILNLSLIIYLIGFFFAFFAKYLI
ncbi:MAG: hypothetical protein VX618_04335 [Thermodesulfobacteriota bacterium]|nr:hypothetical protein [Thermodesulfobacteriota bacterium]